eukprot:SAG31_NODE_2258_length_6069_cov_21.781072_2_plen_139_part_00
MKHNKSDPRPPVVIPRPGVRLKEFSKWWCAVLYRIAAEFLSYRRLDSTCCRALFSTWTLCGRDDQPYALRVAIFRRRKDTKQTSSREQSNESNPIGDGTKYSDTELSNHEFAEYVQKGEALDKKARKSSKKPMETRLV